MGEVRTVLGGGTPSSAGVGRWGQPRNLVAPSSGAGSIGRPAWRGGDVVGVTKLEGHGGRWRSPWPDGTGWRSCHPLRRPRLPAVRRGGQGRTRRCGWSTSGTSRRRCSPPRPRPSCSGAGLAVLTAGPGVTNGVSAIATAHFNGSPVLVLGGRAPTGRWGTGSLQELDHPPLVATLTKHAGTVGDVAGIPGEVDRALRLAAEPHRGPVFLDLALEAVYSQATAELPDPGPPPLRQPDPDAVAAVARLLQDAQRPVLVLGSDVSPAGPRTRPGAVPRPSPCRWWPTGRAAASWPPAATGCWSPGPGRSPSGRPTWWWWPAPRSTSGSATAVSAAATAGPRPRWCTWPTPPGRWPATWSWPGAWPATSA